MAAGLSPENFIYSFPMVGSLQKFLPSNNEEAYSFDEFRMYEFKVRKCTRGRSHDWTECPFAHSGEKARRRDPRKFHYSGTGCPDLRKGSCKKGDSCEFAHGVFECWLHPARYRTQPCKDGRNCRRKVCFFAHTPQQLRLLPSSYNFIPKVFDSCNCCSYDGSSLRFFSKEGEFYEVGSHSVSSPPFLYKNKVDLAQISSPTSTLVGFSPPVSLSGSPPLSLPVARAPNLNNRGQNGKEYDSSGVSHIINSLQQMELNRGCKSCKSPTALFDKTGKGSSSFKSQVQPINAAWRDPIFEDGKGNNNVAEYPDLSWINELVM